MQLNFFKCNDVFDFSSYVENLLISNEGIDAFKQLIYTYYNAHKRDFDWRNEPHVPYHIFISEMMLQQTQTERVKIKFQEFIEAFDSFEKLAQASFKDVLVVWKGLGYNRRAQYIHLAAQRIMSEFNSILPQDPEILKTFKGIGPNTAASICAFAYNAPVVFIETNIRSVFIHHFFQSHAGISDKDILSLVDQTLDRQNARHWYYALMDYGVMIKREYGNPNVKSSHYSIQSKFEGSDRQIRGKILQLLLDNQKLNAYQICNYLSKEPSRVKKILLNLEKDDLINCSKKYYSLK